MENSEIAQPPTSKPIPEIGPESRCEQPVQGNALSWNVAYRPDLGHHRTSRPDPQRLQGQILVGLAQDFSYCARRGAVQTLQVLALFP